MKRFGGGAAHLSTNAAHRGADAAQRSAGTAQVPDPSAACALLPRRAALWRRLSDPG